MRKVSTLICAALLSTAAFGVPAPGRAQSDDPGFVVRLGAEQNAQLNVVSLTPASALVRSTTPLIVTVEAAGPAAPASGVTAVWNGVEVPTTPGDLPNTYKASLDADKLDTIGIYPIALKETGGVANAAQNFTVNNVTPIITTVGATPSPARAGEAVALTISGTEFNDNATVTADGKACTITTRTTTSISCNVAAGELDTLGPLSVIVTNPANGGVAALSSSANNTIQVIHGPPASVDFTPLNPSVAANANQVFTIANIRDQYANEVTTVAERGINWTLSAGATAAGFTIIAESDTSFTIKASATAASYLNAVRADSDATNRKPSAFKQTNVTVVAGAVASVVVDPSSVTLLPGSAQQFTARAFDASGNEVPGATFLWTAAQGSITTAGLHTAGTTAGAYQITATSGGIPGNATVTVIPGPAVRAEFQPANAIITVTGQTLFNLVGYDANNNPTVVNNVAFSTGGGGTVVKLSDQQVRFTAGTTAGVFPNAVRAVSGTITAVAPITVQPGPIDRVIVTPVGITIPPQAPGSKRTFTAKAQDQYGNEITGRTFTWAKDGLPAAAVLTPINATQQAELTNLTVAASYVDAVKATDTASGKVGSASIVVTSAAIDSLTLTPLNPATTPGGRVTFTAVARDAFNNIVAAAISWDVGVAGVIESSGINTITLRATNTAGVYTDAIEASVAGKVARTTVTVNAGAASRVIITPNPGGFGLNSNTQFTAALIDFAGNVIDTPGSKFNWSISGPLTLGATNGNPVTVNSGQTAGMFPNALSVTHSDTGRTTSITITVQPSQLTALRIAPNGASVTVDATQNYSVVGVDQFGNLIGGLLNVSWSTAGGVGAFTQPGVFKAGRTAGIYPGGIIATVGAISASVGVTLTPSSLVNLEIVNNPIIAAGTQRTYNAVGRDGFGNTINNLTVAWSANAGGTIVASGSNTATFRAGFALGTFANALGATAEGRSASINITVAGATITVTAPSNRITTDGRNVMTVTATVRDILANAPIEDGTPITMAITTCSAGSCELLSSPTASGGQPIVVAQTTRNGTVTFWLRSRNTLPPSGILGPTQSSVTVQASFGRESAALPLQGRFEPYRTRLGGAGRDTPNVTNNHVTCQARRLQLPAYVSQLANTTFNIYRVTAPTSALSVSLTRHPNTARVYLYRVITDNCATNATNPPIRIEFLREATTSGGSLQVTFAGLAPQNDYLVAVNMNSDQLVPVAYALEIRAQ
jgi:hypothetical protein